MDKTLRISFGLRNTYRVNAILYSFRQIPIIKKLLPDTLYQVRALKIFANVLSALWEVITVFLWKILYFALMVAGAAALYEGADEEAAVFASSRFSDDSGWFCERKYFHAKPR